MGKRASLSDFTAIKAARDEPPAPIAEREDRPPATERRGQTLRLSPPAWSQLKHLAVDLGVPAHDLLLEAVNDLFRKHGKPPIA